MTVMKGINNIIRKTINDDIITLLHEIKCTARW